MAKTATRAIKLPGTKMELRYELVTPDEARVWLTFNTRNRKQEPRRTGVYARDMDARHWLPGGADAICICEDGTLQNGQHRLAAIVDSSQAQWMMVVRECPAEMQKVIDQGGRRLFHHALQIAQVPNANAVGKSVRCFWRYREGSVLGNRGGGLTTEPTQAELHETLQEHPGLADVTGGRRPPIGMPAGMLAAFDYLVRHGNSQDQAEEWLFLLKSEELPFGHPARTLTARLLRERAKGSRSASTRVRGVWLVMAWNAFAQKESLEKLEYREGRSRPDTPPLIYGCTIIPRNAGDALDAN